MLQDKRISWMVFDIDGVLIDVSQSFMKMFYLIVQIYCERMDLPYQKEKVRHIIHQIKLLPQMNDDWDAGEAILTAYILSLRHQHLHEKLLNQLHSGLPWNQIFPEYSKSLNLDYDLIRHELMSLYGGDKCSSFYGSPNLFTDKEGCYKSEKPLVKSDHLKSIHHHKLIYTGRNHQELSQALHLLKISSDNFAEILDSDSGFLKPDPSPLIGFYQNYIDPKEIGLFLGDSGADQQTVANFNAQVGEKALWYISIGELNHSGDYHFQSVKEALNFFGLI